MQNINFSKDLLGILMMTWILTGCATNPSHEADPFETFNRGVFAINDGIDKIVLKPIAETYTTLVPNPIDVGVTNFFSNINDIIVVANDLLQLKFKQAISDTSRFAINSTVGLLGFIDVASNFDFPKHSEDFGQTLGFWGLGKGPYLVLPLLGPSSVRDTMGLGADSFLDPRFYVTGSNGVTRAMWASEGINKVDLRADLLAGEEVLDVAALDKYSYLRDAYLARREYLVYDENPPLSEEEEDIFDDEEEGEDDEETLEEEINNDGSSEF